MNTQPNQQEQRLTFRLLSYWSRIKGDRPFPSLADMQIADISELWHHTFTLSLVGAPKEHHFQYFGPALASIFNTDYTGEFLEIAMQDVMLSTTLGFYDKVVETRAPASESAEFEYNGKEVRYRSLIVPLSSDGVTIDYLLGTTNYKIF